MPDSIGEGEVIPAAAKDPDYLFRNEFEVLRPGMRGNAVIDGDAVNWSDSKAVKPLLFRQKPGPVNALGHVKFLFPNPYDIYLHDTPSEGLFASEGRAFSHGCVRLEHPKALAKYLLRNRPEWTDEKIAAAMDRETEQPVPLTEGAAGSHRLLHCLAAGRRRRGHLARRLRPRRPASPVRDVRQAPAPSSTMKTSAPAKKPATAKKAATGKKPAVGKKPARKPAKK